MIRTRERPWHRHAALDFQVGPLAGRLVPALGGKLASLTHEGREWLWRNPALVPRLPEAPEAPDAYVRGHDSGGLDECFPTIAATALYPDHGELWTAPATLAVAEAAGALTLTTVHAAPRFGATLTRTLTVSPDAALAFDYALTSPAGGAFLYAHHPLFQVAPGMRIEAAGLDEPWARALPPPVEGRAFKAHLPPAARALALVHPDGATLAMAWEGAIDRAALWVNLAGWAGVEGAPPYYNLAVEPGIGRPDDLEAAVAARDAGAIAPGETLRWRITWRLSA